MLREPNRPQGIEAEAALANCRALINQINAGLSAEQPLVNVSSAKELLFYLEFALLLKKGPHHARESVGRQKSPHLSAALTAPRLRTLHRAEDIGNVLKGGVNVCQQQLVNELLGPLVTEFVRNFSREDATPYQRGSNGSLLGRI